MLWLDTIGLHQMANRSDTVGACTLHLYAPPFDTCKIFCRETGKAYVKPMLYHTVRGVKTQYFEPAACEAACASFSSGSGVPQSST